LNGSYNSKGHILSDLIQESKQTVHLRASFETMASPSLLVRLNTKKIDIDGYKYKTKNGYLTNSGQEKSRNDEHVSG
jgi:hypothetical protein